MTEINAAVIFEPSGQFTLEQLKLSDPRDNEILVRMVGSGICHTDLAGRDRHLPIPLPSVFGHEGAGGVEKVGSRVSKVEPGDHVALSWMCCGACPSCKSGKDPYCENFLQLNFSGARPDGTTTMTKGDQVIHGNFFGQSVFADYALAEERNVVKVPKDVPLEILGPMGCGVQTGAGAVVLPLLGVCGLAGVVPPGTEVSLNMDLIMNGRTVRGIIEGDAIPDLFIPQLIELYRQGRFPFDRRTIHGWARINGC